MSSQELYKSVVITGGKGMLARAFRELLESRGIACDAPDRDELDITSGSAVGAYFDKHHPTLVINCAAYTAVDKAEQEQNLANQINGDGPWHLAAASNDVRAKLVHISTDYVFDGSVSRPLRPDDPVGPRSAYGRSKLRGEEAIRKAAPPGWLILRTAWLYGRGGPNFPQAMVNAARTGKPLNVVTDQFGCPTYTVDLVQATLDLLECEAAGVIHVANAGQTNWRDFAVATLAEFGLRHPVGSITSADWKAIRPDSADRPAYSVFDLAPLERLLGRPMPTWQDALVRYHREIEAAGGF